MARFAPTRAGIINLGDYRDEEFLFVDGWLVLRGARGAGKTRALEAIFPAVLGGRPAPAFLSYIWMEFGDGVSHVTVGAGSCYFVTEGRVGVDLSLVDDQGCPVPRDELQAQAITDSPKEFRRLVDERLFGLGPDRYAQLLDLLIAMRAPQPAKEPDLAHLLLRPLGDELLEEAARLDARLDRVAAQIHRRIVEGRDLVTAVDAQMLAHRPAVGVQWRLADDLDDAHREVCRSLEADPAGLDPVRLRRHFAGRLEAARARWPEKPFRELLAEVFDYRRWWTVEITPPLNRVSLYLPIFAAASALYSAAHPHAPRLLALDEAFAGVDDAGRDELMTLADQYDLDLFLTGRDLWATHPAAHYDLEHSDHTVSAVLLVWDGHLNIADLNGTLARDLGSPATRRVPEI